MHFLAAQVRWKPGTAYIIHMYVHTFLVSTWYILKIQNNHYIIAFYTLYHIINEYFHEKFISLQKSKKNKNMIHISFI